VLRFGLLCLTLCLCTVGLASFLDKTHIVVFGPCASAGAAAIYIAILGSATLGAVFTVLGTGAQLVRKLQRRPS
jgi:hypothetical protein